ncbi:MAG: hypothetical protein SNJ62_06540, partial [Chloracidobacterium sp.]
MQPMPYAPPPPAKKSNVWLWVLGGCGAIAVIGIIATGAFLYFAYYAASRAIDEVSKNPVRTAAKLIENINPDIEVVSVDEEKKLVTFRDKATGTTTTVSLDEFEKQAGRGNASRDDSAAQGGDKSTKSPESDVGISDKDNIPAWVVLYPGAKVIAKVISGSADKASGSLTLKTSDKVDAVFKFYEGKLDGTGFTVTRAAAGGYRAISAKRDSGV